MTIDLKADHFSSRKIFLWHFCKCTLMPPFCVSAKRFWASIFVALCLKNRLKLEKDTNKVLSVRLDGFYFEQSCQKSSSSLLLLYSIISTQRGAVLKDNTWKMLKRRGHKLEPKEMSSIDSKTLSDNYTAFMNLPQCVIILPGAHCVFYSLVLLLYKPQFSAFKQQHKSLLSGPWGSDYGSVL